MSTETNQQHESLQSFKRQLHSLFEVYLAIKIQYECSNPKDVYILTNPYFSYLQLETTKVILGRLIVLLADDRKKYKTVSFSILIYDLFDSTIELEHAQRIELENILAEISTKKTAFADFRDKQFAHIELNDDNSLKTFGFNYRDVNELLELAKKSYDTLFSILCGASSDHIQRQIDSISNKLWKLYAAEGLARKVIK